MCFCCRFQLALSCRGRMEGSVSGTPLSADGDGGSYSVYFGVSCAFVAVQLLRERRGELGEGKWSVLTESMLQGTAQLLGLLAWKAGRREDAEERSELLNQLKKAQMDVEELRVQRTQDAKANEKVVSIFASQEQGWICERKRLRLQIQALVNELRKVYARSNQVVSNLNDKIKEKEEVIRSRDEVLEEEGKKIKELEERLKITENVVEELRENIKKEAQEHSSELWKQKTAFIELVSKQRQLEADMGRAVREVEATRQELESVFEQKEDSAMMVEKLSVELVKLRNDAEQKDQILSAMLRKSKLDTSEKQILLKEVKISKARRKQAELEAERWKTHSDPRNERQLRGSLVSRTDLRLERLGEMKGLEPIQVGCSQDQSGLNPNPLLLECFESDHQIESESHSPNAMDVASIDSFLRYSPGADGELVVSANLKQLEDWVRMETLKYTSVIEQRHCAEIEAFAEQMRFKDQKLEACNWRLLSMELESKQLQSHVEGLEDNLSQFREENMKLEALLLDREKELKSLKGKLTSCTQKPRKSNTSYAARFQSLDPVALWSEVKIIKKKLNEKGQDEKGTFDSETGQMEMAAAEDNGSESSSLNEDFTVPITSAIYKQTMEEQGKPEKQCENQSTELDSAVPASEEVIEVEKVVVVDPCHEVAENLPHNSPDDTRPGNRSGTLGYSFARKGSPWKMDLHALGVSYKIKRLKQQLLLLERLSGVHLLKRAAGNEESDHGTKDFDDGKRVLLMITLLNKQVKRYQSLEEKTNDLCKRMDNTDRTGKNADCGQAKKETQSLESFLEETFQLQRYMVATGQKLMEVQSKISRDFMGGFEGGKCDGLDIRQFAENVKTLLREVQRGLEVRIARIIGDLEGTLACEGILHLRS